MYSSMFYVRVFIHNKPSQKVLIVNKPMYSVNIYGRDVEEIMPKVEYYRKLNIEKLINFFGH